MSRYETERGGLGYEIAVFESSTRRTADLGPVSVNLDLDFLRGHWRQWFGGELLACLEQAFNALGAQRFAHQPFQFFGREQPRLLRFLREAVR